MATIDIALAQGLLDYITNIDLQEVMGRKPFIPCFGDEYTEVQLMAWLKEASDFLTLLINNPNIDIAIQRTALRNALSSSAQVLADEMISTNKYFLFGSWGDGKTIDDLGDYNVLRKLGALHHVLI